MGCAYYPHYSQLVFISLTLEGKGLLEEEIDEDVDPPTSCCRSCLVPVIHEEEDAIELVEIKDDVKEVVECLNCDECFDTISLFEDHLASIHQIDRQTLTAYTKLVSNKTTTEQGNPILSKLCIIRHK